MPIVGFLSGDDPRVRSTIDVIARERGDDTGLLYRYRVDEASTETRGVFLLCTLWLARSLALAGESVRAKAPFARSLACGNDLGLFAEEADALTGESAGKFPASV